MSTKATQAKKAKLKAARKKNELKAINRARGMAKDFGLTHADAKFYLKAIKNSDSPIQFLEGTYADIKTSLEKFSVINTVAEDQELMEGLKTHTPLNATNISEAHEFLKSISVDLEKIYTESKPDIEKLGTRPEDFAACFNVVEGFNIIQDNLMANAGTLLKVVESIYNMIADAEAHVNETTTKQEEVV